LAVSKKRFFSLSVFLATALGNAGSTLYLPALLQIGHELNASNAEMKLSLSIYLLSIGISQLFYGPLSDAFGRRINFLVGLVLFFVGSLFATLADSAVVLLASRLLQGLGIGVANAVGFALLRDLYSGAHLIRQLSYQSLFVGLTPILAPLLGGYLVTYLGWRSCFAFLTLGAIILWAMKYFFLSETNFSIDTKACHPRIVLKNFRTLLNNVVFLSFVLSASMGFASVLTLNAMLPFTLIGGLGVTPAVYGWLTICTGAGYISGAYLGGIAASKFGLVRTLISSILLEILACILGLLISFEHSSILSVLLPSIFILLGVGSIVPLASGGAMKLFPNIAGSAAALLGAFMFLIASLFTTLAAHLHQNSARILFIALLTMGMLTMFVCLIAKGREEHHV
jgi:Bcr/CflA subfamily drug resistance transporter